ncbi:MAG: hypothetical protein ACFFBD_14810 [Candidatus Hodarchaeota archaeon]
MSESQESTNENLKEEIRKLRKKAELLENLLKEEEEKFTQQSQREDRVTRILENKLKKSESILKELQEKNQLQKREIEELKSEAESDSAHSEKILNGLRNEFNSRIKTHSMLQTTLERLNSKKISLKNQIGEANGILAELIAQKEKKSEKSHQAPEELTKIISDLTAKKIQLESILRKKKKQEEQMLEELKSIELKLAEETEKYMRLQSITNNEMQRGW